MSNRSGVIWKVAGISVLLVALIWVVFGQTMGHRFINFDDESYVYANPVISHGLTPDAISWAFTHIVSHNWHPLTTISHMTDCQLFDLKPAGHHLINVLLHTIAAILLLIVLYQMTGALWRSAFVAAIFAIHPLHVESVAWVAERKDVLSAVFFMLGLGAYVRYARAPSIARYLAVAALLALGLMSKPMLVTLPFVLLLLDYWPLNRFSQATSVKSKGKWLAWWERQSLPRRLILEKIPLIALSAISGTVTFLSQRQALGWTEDLPVSLRFNNAVVTCIAYIWQMLWPAKLAVFYPHPENRVPLWEIILALAVVIAITLTGNVLRRKRPYFITGWLWYLGMLVPVIGVIQVGWQGRADRYTYLPQIGLYVLAAWAVPDLSASWRRQRQIAAVGAAILLGALTWRAWNQASFWRNSETLWAHTLAVTSDNDVAENNLGIIFLGRGQVDEAISRFQT